MLFSCDHVVAYIFTHALYTVIIIFIFNVIFLRSFIYLIHMIIIFTFNAIVCVKSCFCFFCFFHFS